MSTREEALSQLATSSRAHTHATPSETIPSPADDPLEVLQNDRSFDAAVQTATAKLQNLRAQLQSAQQSLEECIRDCRSHATGARHAERTRLAQVLHDGLQQVLVAARMRLESAVRTLPPGPNRIAVDESRVLLVEAIKVSRTLTLDLSPLHFLDDGLAAAMSWLADWFVKQHHFHIEVDIDTDAEPASTEFRRLLFQSVRELLFNCVKHSAVDSARLSMHRVGSNLQIIVEDAGVGFRTDPMPDNSGSLGLFAVKRRVESLGGAVDIVSAPGQGTRVTITAPLG